MENESKPVRFEILAAEIVHTLQARQSSKATGRSRILKVVPINSSHKPTTNLPKRKGRFGDAPSKIIKVRKINSAR